MYGWVCVWRLRTTSGVIPPVLATLVAETRSLSSLELAKLARLAGQ